MDEPHLMILFSGLPPISVISSTYTILITSTMIVSLGVMCFIFPKQHLLRHTETVYGVLMPYAWCLCAVKWPDKLKITVNTILVPRLLIAFWNLLVTSDDVTICTPRHFTRNKLKTSEMCKYTFISKQFLQSQHYMLISQMSPAPLLMMCCLYVSVICGGVHLSNRQVLVGPAEYP